MRRRIVIGTGLAVIVAVGVAFAIPYSRYQLLSLVDGEELYGGRPTRVWLAAMRDDDAAVRRQAAIVLGEVNAADADVVSALVKGLADPDNFVRKCAATSFLLHSRDAKVPDDAATVQSLHAALKDDETVVRQAAVRALWQAGPAAKEGDGVRRITLALDDRNEVVRAYACRALAKIGPDAKESVPVLLTHLQSDEDRDIRKLAAKSMGLIGRDAVGAHLPATIEALQLSLKEEPRGLREYAARSLGQLRAKKAISALQLATKDRDAGVKAAAIAAIKAIEQDTPANTP